MILDIQYFLTVAELFITEDTNNCANEVTERALVIVL